jgi:hypothetical protein
VFYQLNYTRTCVYSTFKKLKIQLLNFSFFRLFSHAKWKKQAKKEIIENEKNFYLSKRLKKKDVNHLYQFKPIMQESPYFFLKCRKQKKRKIVVFFASL